nr:TdeIII family type II restriction endonuclease [Helicobacter bilis]
MKQAIKNRLIQALRNKFENYKPESNYMPFHTRLLGKVEWLYIVLYKALIQILAQVFLNLLQKSWD